MPNIVMQTPKWCQMHKLAHCQISTLPLADVIGCLFGKHPLLEHVVEGMNGAQLQPLLLMEHFSFTHSNAGMEQGWERRATLANIWLRAAVSTLKLTSI